MGIRTDEGQEHIAKQDGGCDWNKTTVTQLQTEARMFYIPRPDSNLFRVGT